MIVIRILDGITNHFPIRASEWLAIYPAAFVGVVLFLNPSVFDTSSAYEIVQSWMSETFWALLFMGCAWLRLIALTVNGTFSSFRWSPTIRFLVSVVTAMAWGQFCLGFFLEWLSTGRTTFLTILLSHMVVAECLNCFRSSRDMAEESHGRRSYLE